MPTNSSNGKGLSRRQVLTGALAIGSAVSMPGLTRAAAKSTKKPQMLSAQAFAARSCSTLTTMRDGNALLVGGLIGSRATAGVLAIDPSSGTYRVAAPMNTARARHCAVALDDGRVIVLGGSNGRLLRSVEIYDPAVNRWTSLAPLAIARADFSAVMTPAGLLIVGGVGPDGPLGSTLITNLFDATEPIP